MKKVALCNINKNDKYVEILVEAESSNPKKTKNCVFLRYNEGDVSTLFSYKEKDKKNRYSVDDIRGEWIIKGNWYMQLKMIIN